MEQTLVPDCGEEDQLDLGDAMIGLPVSQAMSQPISPNQMQESGHGIPNLLVGCGGSVEDRGVVSDEFPPVFTQEILVPDHSSCSVWQLARESELISEFVNCQRPRIPIMHGEG
ncbi:hypothetical protein LINGRAHAP2_LOCUS7163, partial [Linum grandiflorum]